MSSADDLAYMILDACSALNLYSTGRIREILKAQAFRFGVVDYVARREALYVYSGTDNAGTRFHEHIDWSTLFTSGDLEELTLNESEAEMFVGLAAVVDDGEAMSCAVAICRRGSIATDDRKTRRIMAEYAPNVRVHTTSELIKAWSDAANVTGSELRQILLDVQDRGGFVPGRNDPLKTWWDECMGMQG